MTTNENDKAESPEAVPRGDNPGVIDIDNGFSLMTVIEDAKRVILDPMSFYRDMSRSGGYAEPAIFVAVMAVVLGLIMTVFALFGAGHLGAIAVSIGSVIIMPIMAVIGSFIGALIMFVIWKLMGSTQNYEAAYRSVAFASAIYPVMGVLSVVPYIGTIVGVLWGFYLMYAASIEVHGIKKETARIAIGILVVICLFMQISAEVASRKFASKAEEVGQGLEQMGEKYEDLGEALGETLGESLGSSLDDLESMEDMTPEEAGQKLGEFFKKLEQGMEGFEKGFEESAGPEAAKGAD